MEEVHGVPLVEGRIVSAGTQVLDEDPIELAGDEPVAYVGGPEPQAVGACCYAAERYAFPYCLRQWPWFSSRRRWWA